MTTHPTVPVRVYFAVFTALITLTLLTTYIAYVDLGIFNTIVALTIAVIKAVLVLLFFMHLRYTGRLPWVFAVTGALWLLLVIGGTMTDEVSRPWLGTANPF